VDKKRTMKKEQKMKKLHWLVIVIVCCAPPCLWTACDRADENDEAQEDCATWQEVYNGCEAVYETAVAEWRWCTETYDMPAGKVEMVWNVLPVFQQLCEAYGENSCVDVDDYETCIDSGIKCSPELVDMTLTPICMQVLED
jgi:hypothetical protein